MLSLLVNRDCFKSVRKCAPHESGRDLALSICRFVFSDDSGLAALVAMMHSAHLFIH